jgi:hypothetical protein
MPTVDERLEQLFSEAAAEPAAAADVLGAVAHKRRQRHTRRVARHVGVLAVAALAVVGSVAWFATDERSDPTVAARVTGTDAWRRAREISLAPDRGYLRAPIITSGADITVAAYDRDGTGFKVPPARVVRIDADGDVRDEVELQGEILSLAEGEGARWVVTHDGDNVSPRQYRVKRIGADGSVVSNAFPPGVEPTGPIVAGGGAAWVPVEHGVLQFAPATGAYVGTVAPPDAERVPRLVRIGSAVYAYAATGSTLVRLDATTPEAPGATSTDVTLLGIAATPEGAWALASTGGRAMVAPFDLTNGAFDRARGPSLPRGFAGSDLLAAGDTLWILGRVDNEPAIVRIARRADGTVVAEPPVLFRWPPQSDVVAFQGDELLVTSEGRLYRVAIGG